MNLKNLHRQLSSLLAIVFPVVGSIASIAGLVVFLGERLGASSISFSVISGIIAAAVGLFAKPLVQRIRRLQSSPRVFLSYSHLEKPLAREIFSALHDAGARVWIDEENLRVGESIVPTIERAMGESDSFVVLLGAKSSPNVLMELGMARKQGLRIVPVVIGDAEIPSDLDGLFYLKVNGENRKVIEKVVESVA